MQVSVGQTDPCKIELNIEIEPDKVAETIEEVYREFSRSTAVPGFRKGKAPRKIVERYVSPESVRRRAVDLMVPPAYREALEKQEIHPYAEPEIEIVQLDMEQPFVFKATVPLPPKIELGEYKGIEVERPPVKVTDEDIEAQLKYLQESRATSEKVENRGAETGDLVVAEVASAVEGQEKGAPRRSLLEIGSNVPEFDTNLIGLKPGERRTFTVQYPDSPEVADKELAGKKVDFDVTVESVRQRQIPELNDDFAKTVGDFKSLADLRKDIEDRLTASAEEGADREVERKIVDEIVSRSKVDFPDVLVEREVRCDLEDMQSRLDRQRLSLEQYLRQSGMTQEQLLSKLRETATERVRNGLVLARISEAENFDITGKDVDAEIERIAADSKATRESVETYIETRGGREALKNSLLGRKITDFLKSASTIK